MKKILIVEDDDKIAEIEQDYLLANGFEVERAADGRSGLAMARQDQYDLILLDIMLPGLDGFAVCRELRRYKEVPVLMVTARQEEVDVLRGLGVGADDYIMKPFNPNELVARVRSHIARYERILASVKPEQHVVKSGALEISSTRTACSWTRRKSRSRGASLSCSPSCGASEHRLQPGGALRAGLGRRGTRRLSDGHGAYQPHPREDRRGPCASALPRDHPRRGYRFRLATPA